MKKATRFISRVLACAMALCVFTACGDSNGPVQGPVATPEPVVTETPAPDPTPTPTSTPAAVTEETEIAYTSSKTYSFIKQFTSIGKYMAEYDYEENGEVSHRVVALDGVKYYRADTLDDGFTGKFWWDSDYIYYTDYAETFNSETIVIKYPKETSTTTDSGITEYLPGGSNVTKFTKGTSTIDGIEYYSETMTCYDGSKNIEKETLCFQGNDLKAIIVEGFGTKTTVKNINVSTSFDESVFTSYNDYTVMTDKEFEAAQNQ